MKRYTVTYYNKVNNATITRTMTISAETAKAARAKFDAAYKAAKTGCHAFGIAVRLAKEDTP